MLKERYPDITSSQVGVNFITPPDITAMLIRDAYQYGIRNFLCQPETIQEDMLEELKNDYSDVHIIEDNAPEYLYFEFFSDEANLRSISEEQRKMMHALEWIEDEIFERGTLNEVVHDAGH